MDGGPKDDVDPVPEPDSSLVRVDDDGGGMGMDRSRPTTGSLQLLLKIMMIEERSDRIGEGVAAGGLSYSTVLVRVRVR